MEKMTVQVGAARMELEIEDGFCTAWVLCT